MTTSQRFLIKGVRYRADDPALQAALASIYNTNESPYCMCRPDGVRMYVAKYAEYVIKRLPETGQDHHPSCPSYELPPTESGLGELLGEAIVDHNNDRVELRVAFPLARVPGRSVQRSPGATPGEVAVSRKSLSLRGMMHWLWEQAGFNRWYPNMTGKRSWGVIRKFVLQQAERAQTKGTSLRTVLYMPEPFRPQDADAAIARRREVFRELNSPQSDLQFRMLIVVGELADVQDAVVARRLLVKHMQDTPLLVDEEAWKRMQKAFGPALEAKATDPSLRAIIAALVYAKRDRVYHVDRASLMLTTETWIPVDDLNEVRLIRHLIEHGRSFLKPLRYESRRFGQYPNVKLLDTGKDSLPLDILSPFSDDDVRATKLKAIKQRCPASWVWVTSEPIPELPPKLRREHGASQRVPDAATPARTADADVGASP